MLWGMFFDYASYTSALAWAGLFAWPTIKTTIKKIRARNNSKNGESINFQYNDQLNILMRAYKEVPVWWYIALFSASFIAITSMVASGHLYIPYWTYLIALATGAIMVTPLGWLYALSNYQLPIGTTNELLYGVMINAVSGHKNPTGATVYSSIAGDAWYRAQLMLQDQKIGHYMHIPPRATFLLSSFRCHDRNSHQLRCDPLGDRDQGRVLDRGEERSFCAMDRSSSYKCALIICAIRT